ncbi:hypothetical protein HRI_004748300 [Hibiscus trionum]|uniref:Reverse transcriptase Ty1/copia-type domain-containing protein n=1 Tax=Hibiscus trionum TaxID=183268 RepID=A0A9W7J8S8_HIBTR|nr:hypothetical protein HRI_004748300 [Hibiscus trionum]
MKGYKVYILKSQSIVISRDVVFHEGIFPFHSINTSEVSIDFFPDICLPRGSSISSPDSSAQFDVFRIPSRMQDTEPTVGVGVPIEPVIETVTDPVHEPIPELPTKGVMQNVEPVVVPDLVHDRVSSNFAEPVAELVNNHVLPANVKPVVEHVSLDDSLHVHGSSIEPEPRRSTRVAKKPSYLHQYYCNVASSSCSYPIEHQIVSSSVSPSHATFLANLCSTSEPFFYHQAVRLPEWRAAMQDELRAMEMLQTWSVVSIPPGKQPIDCKWVYRIKHNSDGTIDRYKARLVAKGFTQVEGIDYTDTFSPVAKMTSFKVLLSLAAVHGWHLLQLDVNNAFLNGTLDEEVYMKLPLGYETTVQGNDLVCKLQKSIYGLKQASRQWFQTFHAVVLQFGFVQSPSEHSLFIKGCGDDLVALLVYVDDVVIAGKHLDSLLAVQNFLKSHFKLKELGPLKYFPGFEVSRQPDGISLCQRHYALQLLEETGSLGKKPAALPIVANHKLSIHDGELLPDPQVYRRLVGRLLYLTHTRPDITCVVHQLSQFVSTPRLPHLNAAHHLLSYIKKAPGLGLFFHSKANLQLSCFVDSDYSACPDTRRSITGFCTYLGTNLISWKSKKQHTMSRSTCEAEYRAMASATCELVWLAALLSSFHIDTSPVFLYCDNQAALHLASNQVFHERSKHIEVDCHFVREKLNSGFLKLFHIRSQGQLADIFTKALHLPSFSAFLLKMGLIDVHPSPS